MTQHVNQLLREFPDLAEASGVSATDLRTRTDAAVGAHDALNAYAPGGRVTYDSPEQEAQAVARIEAVWELVERVRDAGRKVLDGTPRAVFARLWCQLDNPGEYVLEPEDVAEADRAQYAVYADLRHQVEPASFAADLARLAQLPSLRLVALYYNDLSVREVAGLGLDDLPELRGLDLGQNRLSTVPLASTSLTFLGLAGNPLAEAPDLDALPALRWLDLTATGLDPAAIDAVRAARSELTVWS